MNQYRIFLFTLFFCAGILPGIRGVAAEEATIGVMTPPPVETTTGTMAEVALPALPALQASDQTPAPAAQPPQTTEPAAEAVDASEDTLSPGDFVRIRMDEDPSIVFEGLISAVGTVPIPFLGECAIARKTSTEAAAAISGALTGKMYQKATISVTLVTKAQGKVFIYGAVRKPGAIMMPTVGDLTILQAISYADGLTSWATAEDAYILRKTRHGKPAQKIPLNLSQIFASAMPMSDSDVVLRPDDVVCVPGINGALFFSSDTCEVMVTGEVNGNAGLVTFAPGEQRMAMRAIFKAGGFSKFANKKQVRIIHYGKNKERTEKRFNATKLLDEGMLSEDVELSPGDMIIVPEKWINF